MNWRHLPYDDRYELSDTGRMRGPYGLLKPLVQRKGKPSAARYKLSMVDAGYVNVSRAMEYVWGIVFEPTWAWFHEICAEIAASKASRKAEHRSKARLESREWRAESGTSRPLRESTGGAGRSSTPVLCIVQDQVGVQKQPKRHCADCGRMLSGGYWRRCKACWWIVRKGFDMPLEEYGTAGRR